MAKEAKERQRGGQGGVLLPQKFAEASKTLVEKFPEAFKTLVEKIPQAIKGRGQRNSRSNIVAKMPQSDQGRAREIAAKKFIQTMDRFLSSQLLPGSTQLQVGFPHTGIPENGESLGV